MRHVTIDEIQNGFIVKFFVDYPSPEKFDYEKYFETWPDALDEITSWLKKVVTK